MLSRNSVSGKLKIHFTNFKPSYSNWHWIIPPAVNRYKTGKKKWSNCFQQWATGNAKLQSLREQRSTWWLVPCPALTLGPSCDGGTMSWSPNRAPLSPTKHSPTELKKQRSEFWAWKGWNPQAGALERRSLCQKRAALLADVGVHGQGSAVCAQSKPPQPYHIAAVMALRTEQRYRGQAVLGKLTFLLCQSGKIHFIPQASSWNTRKTMLLDWGPCYGPARFESHQVRGT